METPLVNEIPELETKQVIDKVEKTVLKESVPEDMPSSPEATSLTPKEAFEFSLNLKTNTVSSRTLSDYRERGNTFLKWLESEHPEIKSITEIERKTLILFFNSVQLRTSARNRNNFRTCLNAILQMLEDNEIIIKN